MKRNNDLTAPAVNAEDAKQCSTLSTDERREFAACERQVAQGNAQAALALKTIHDKKLYRREFGRWEDYVADRWEMTRSYSFQLLFFAAMYSAITQAKKSADGRLLPEPSAERQVRPLSRLSDDATRLQAWADATERNGGKRPSSALVEQVVNEMLPVEQHEPTYAVDGGASADTLDVVTSSNEGGGSAAISEPAGDFVPACTARIYDALPTDKDTCISQPAGEPEGMQMPSASISHEITSVQEADQPAITTPVKLALVSYQAPEAKSPARADTLAAACRDVVSAAVDETIAHRVYEAVRDIVAEALRQQAA